MYTSLRMRGALNKPWLYARQQCSPLRAYSTEPSRYKAAPRAKSSSLSSADISNRAANANLLRLVEAYRVYGHNNADLDPIGMAVRTKDAQLDPALYALSAQKYATNGIINVGKDSSLSEITSHLEKSYCEKIAIQANHIENEEERQWLYNKVEEAPSSSATKEDKLRLYESLSKTQSFDHFMAKKFPTLKRYGLEGAESMVPFIEEALQKGAEAGLKDVVIGMPHRGRLNLLAGLLKYRPRDIFWKVKGNSEFPEGVLGSGDVLSHIGTSVDLKYPKGDLHVSLIQNPSHLEAANPVAMGKVRAKQSFHNDKTGDKVACLLLHGDAAFAGQGVVTESLSLANLPGFSVGGTIHLIVNNQIGFTTPSLHSRSSTYSSDVAKIIGAPILLVNADSPEDVIKVARIAMEYRQKFKRDIVVDLIGYRRLGHNEMDEPAFTQPLMYAIVRGKPTVVASYGQQLTKDGILTEKHAKDLVEAEDARLNGEFAAMTDYKHPQPDHLQGKWNKIEQVAKADVSPNTGVDIAKLRKIGEDSVALGNTEIHSRLVRGYTKPRTDALKAGTSIDWATAEALAIGSLMSEGFNVRLVGQDVGRGTFSHRHFELVDAKTEKIYMPLNNMKVEGKGHLEVVNSNLSEMAVLGFEYGYSVEDPKNLCLWEAQFGDFANGAQIIIDQFLASGEVKWLKQSGLTMLLPHGYDGAGPEHSSARIERFLQLVDVEGVNVGSAEVFRQNPNMQVIHPSTPANYFHALRRQQHRQYRKPMIVIAPKVLLRLPTAVSPLEHMGPNSHFLPLINDPHAELAADKVERVVFCSGKIYYDLVVEREKRRAFNTAFVRIEELSPFPYAEIQNSLTKVYPNAKKVYWAQEESQNAGAWSYVEPRFVNLTAHVNTKIQYVGRPPLGASAVGISLVHKREAENIIREAFEK